MMMKVETSQIKSVWNNAVEMLEFLKIYINQVDRIANTRKIKSGSRVHIPYESVVFSYV